MKYYPGTLAQKVCIRLPSLDLKGLDADHFEILHIKVNQVIHSIQFYS
jgi:hypothetical protein